MSSCAPIYFYSTLTSLNEDLQQTDNGDFISDSDSLLVAYWFNGENTPIYINVYNKTDKPLYVDWSRSSLIKDGQAISYQGRISSVSDGGQHYPWLDDQVFIPPHSRKTFYSPVLSAFQYGDLDNQYFKKDTVRMAGGYTTSVKRLDFSTKTTPLRFRSYLSFYTNNSNEPFSVEHDFYVSNLMKGQGIGSNDMKSDFGLRGDVSYTLKNSKNKAFFEGVGIVVGTAALVGVVVVGAANGVSFDDYEDDF